MCIHLFYFLTIAKSEHFKRKTENYCRSTYCRWVKISLFLKQIQFRWHLIPSYRYLLYSLLLGIQIRRGFSFVDLCCQRKIRN